MPVYFIQAGEGGPIKIGWSRDPEQRLRSLQDMHYTELKLLGYVAGCTALERAVQDKFRQYAVRGTWYHPVPEVLAASRDLLLATTVEISNSSRTAQRSAYGGAPLSDLLASGKIRADGSLPPLVQHQPAAEKRCSVCREVKPASAFTKAPRIRTGLTSACKPCHSARVRAYQKRIAAERAA